MSYARLRIYGSDVDYSTNDFSVPKTTLDASTVPYMDMDVAVINASPIRDVEMIDYFGNIRKQTVSCRYGASPESTPMDFDNSSSFDSFWRTDIFDKNFNYLYFDTSVSDYPLKPVNLSSTDCLCINVTQIEPIHNREQGVKYLNLTIEQR